MMMIYLLNGITIARKTQVNELYLFCSGSGAFNSPINSPETVGVGGVGFPASSPNFLLISPGIIFNN